MVTITFADRETEKRALGFLLGRFSGRVKISLPGGKVKIKWEGAGRSLWMLGPACLVYEGRIDV